MKNRKLFLFLICACLLFCFRTQLTAATIELQGDNLVLNFEGEGFEGYNVLRAQGRVGNFQPVGTVTDNAFTDENVTDSPYSYYYQVKNGEEVVALLALDIELFGPNVYIFSPEDNRGQINTIVNGIHDKMFHEQFGLDRYAIYFKPGDYTESGQFNVPYYMHLAGLGELPYDVKIDNIYTPAPLPDNNGTCTFWRAVENFSIVKNPAGVYDEEEGGIVPDEGWCLWAVSQAAPIRRVHSERNVMFETGGWVSGGFAANCHFDNSIGSWAQQQWYTRNCYIGTGSNGMSQGQWNWAYQGVEFGGSVNINNHSDDWSRRGHVSRVETTPIIREKPFLFLSDTDGRYKVFKPALKEETAGIAWNTESKGDGEVFDLLDDFYVVKPGTTAQEMNAQLSAGKHVFITPGQYELSEPLRIENANTIVLGAGLATLIPAESNTTAAIVVNDVDGVTIAGLLFDTYYSSQRLLQVGAPGANQDHSNNPTVLSDLFFRVGGVKNQNTNVDIAVEINSNDVIGDHFWIWRADHGAGVGWTRNTSKNGLVVNGDNVTMYGLFNEHFQEYQTVWNGENGRTYFYQSETPYDPQSQAGYMSHDGTVDGYASYKVADGVMNHYACMMGVYDVFTKTGGAKIAIENSIEVPAVADNVKIHHACNVRLSSAGSGIRYIVNGTQKSTLFGGNMRAYIVDFESAKSAVTPIQQGAGSSNFYQIYPNPVEDYLTIASDYENISISIFDVNGNKIFEQKGNEPINMQSYASGIYFINAFTENGLNQVGKIIKK